MTARIPPQPGGLNRSGSGRGMKKVPKPLPKKRGAAADRSEIALDTRRKYTNISAVPTAETADHVDPNKPLTEKARAFVKFWAQGDSIPSAAAKAGYGDGATYAYRVARYPQAIALYNEEKRKYEEASQMTRKQVMDGLLEGIEMAKLLAEPASVISGWREIGKMCGYYEPIRKTIKLTVEGEVAIKKMETMSDADLLKILQGSMPLLEQAIHDGDEDDDA